MRKILGIFSSKKEPKKRELRPLNVNGKWSEAVRRIIDGTYCPQEARWKFEEMVQTDVFKTLDLDEQKIRAGLCRIFEKECRQFLQELRADANRPWKDQLWAGAKNMRASFIRKAVADGFTNFATLGTNDAELKKLSADNSILGIVKSKNNSEVVKSPVAKKNK